MSWDDPILEPPVERDRPTWSDLAYKDWAEKEERDLERDEHSVNIHQKVNE